MGKHEEDDVDLSFIDEIGKIIEEEQKKPYIKNEERIELVKKLYEIAKTIFVGNYKSSLKFNKPFKGMGSITLEGKKLECIAPDYLIIISKAANNINIYSKMNGDVVFNFCFYGCEIMVK